MSRSKTEKLPSGADKLPSGGYRVRKQKNGKRHTLIFDHKPTEREIDAAFLDLFKSLKISVNGKMTFYQCAESYIDSKSSVLSPGSVREYKGKLRRIPDDFSCRPVDDITQLEVQKVVNDYAEKHSPKSVADYSSFITASITMFRPDTVFKITLPQKIKPQPYIPDKDDIKVILTECKGTPFEVPIRLGCYGLRRSEVCALTISDLSADNSITINKAIVQDQNKQWVVKTTKTVESTRTIKIDQDLADLIRSQGYVYQGYPNSISNWMKRTEKKHGMKEFSVHKLRHHFASAMHDMGIPDSEIIKLGGWSTDHVMKSVYRHETQSTMDKAQESMIKYLAGMQQKVVTKWSRKSVNSIK